MLPETTSFVHIHVGRAVLALAIADRSTFSTTGAMRLFVLRKDVDCLARVPPADQIHHQPRFLRRTRMYLASLWLP